LRSPADGNQAAVLRLFYSWMFTVLGALTVLLGAWLLLGRGAGDASPPQPHHDFAGPTDFSSVSARDVALISTGMIVLGCGFVGIGWWLRRKKVSRAVRDD
jgi:hypothetical protein